ncbi:MAG TPA: glycosyltransferase family 4 protein [Candidatus Kapabacteria bacterium]|nr:glycosyltransferase family 4 protein [Candidatus Kapabacteria bacterium]
MKITLVGPLISTFVKNDVTILRTAHDVDALDSGPRKGQAGALWLLVLQLKIIGSMLRRDALFFWFADYYSFVPSLIARMLGKRVFVVAGGFDVLYLPELGIGARCRPLRWFAVRNTFRLAHHIFPVSLDLQNLLDEAVPNHSPSTMIYNAVDTKTYHFDPRPRKRIAITISHANTISEYSIKGLDLFIRVAKELPDVEFRIIGLRDAMPDKARLEAAGMPNVSVLPGRHPMDPEEFWNASVYCQLSVKEAFGLAVAEAMSCGCIPVISRVASMMEIVGETGCVVNRSDTKVIADAIHTALESSEAERQAASKQAAKFDISERAKKLLAVVSAVGNSS